MLDAIAVWVFAIVLPVYAAVLLAAITTCVGDDRLTSVQRRNWLIGIVVLPVVEPLGWLVVGRTSRRLAAG